MAIYFHVMTEAKNPVWAKNPVLVIHVIVLFYSVRNQQNKCSVHILVKDKHFNMFLYRYITRCVFNSKIDV